MEVSGISCYGDLYYVFQMSPFQLFEHQKFEVVWRKVVGQKSHRQIAL